MLFSSELMKEEAREKDLGKWYSTLIADNSFVSKMLWDIADTLAKIDFEKN